MFVYHNPPRGRRCALSAATAVLVLCGQAWAQPTTPSITVAAEVNSTRVYVHLLEQDLKSSIKGRQLTPPARRVLQARILDRVVTRIAIIDFLATTAEGAKPQQIEAAIDHLKKQLANRNTTLDQFLKKSKMLESDLRTKLAWQICWGQYLRRYVTEANLRSYFDMNRRQFDGTKLRVQHILLKNSSGGSAAESRSARLRAEKLRADILAGKTTFAEAARLHSQSPSRAKDGDIGWISRHKPMVDSFSRAAFALKKGGLSEPIKTPHGVHLIRCTDIKAGKRTWKEAEGELRKAVAEFLLQWLGKKARQGARISFTSAWPHFDPSSGQLK